MDNSINLYIEQFPPQLQAKLFEIKSAIEKAAPYLDGRIAWNMPAYFFERDDIIEFAVHNNFISLHIGECAFVNFQESLQPYSVSKNRNVIHFSFDDEIPCELISKIVEHNVNRAFYGPFVML